MKKLMIATVAVASMVAVADICDPLEASADGRGCRAYDFAASVKLVDGKRGKVAAESICDNEGRAYYRVKATRKFKGVFTDCNTCSAYDVTTDPTKETWQGKQAEQLLVGEANTPGINGIAHGAMFYIATSAQKYKYVYNGSYYVDPTLNGYVDSYTFLILNYFGSGSYSKSKVAEGLVQINFVERDQYREDRAYSILCAGFGARTGALLKNLSGNLAGAVASATWCGIPTICWEPCLETPYYTALNFDQQGNYIDTTPNPPNAWAGMSPVSPNYDAVSGTWSLKYNASKSKLSTADALMKKSFNKDYELMTGAAAPVFPFNLITLN